MDVRFHLPVLSECDIDCKLCGLLGCLRPAQLTFTEFLGELDRAALLCSQSIVFAPNFLNHPDASQFCKEAVSRGLRVITRLRPSQLTSSSELLLELEFRGAEFEVVVAEPMTPIQTRLSFKTIFVPSRVHDPALLYDALPFSWRRDLEVLGCAQLISPDDLYFFMSKHGLKTYADTSRLAVGSIPGAREKVRRFGSRVDFVRFSVIVFNPTVSMLEALNVQVLERDLYEVVGVGYSDDVLSWASTNALAVTLIEPPLSWGTSTPRRTQAFSIGALHARGVRLIFVEADFPIESGFLNRAAEWPQALVTIESRSEDKPVRRALMMATGQYFASGGFELSHDGFEFDFALWKTPGPVWILGDVDKDGVPALPPKMSAERSLSAQDFYLATLDANVYRNFYSLMGRGSRRRRAARFVFSIGLVQMMISGVDHLVRHYEAMKLKSQMRRCRRTLGGRA